MSARDAPEEIYRAAQDGQVMTGYVLDRTREKAPNGELEAATERQLPVLQPVLLVEEQLGKRRHIPREVARPIRLRVCTGTVLAGRVGLDGLGRPLVRSWDLP